MQSKRFRLAWNVHQTLPRYAAAAIAQRNASVLDALALSAAALVYVMPCSHCRDSYRNYRKYASADRVLQQQRPTRETYERYYYTMHNFVNAKLHKTVVGEREREAAYQRLVAENAHRFRCDLIEWLAIVAMNYDNVGPPALLMGDRKRFWNCFNKAMCAVVVKTDRGDWLREANRNDADVLSVVDEWIDKQLPLELLDCCPSMLHRWRKLLWHVIYIDSLLRVMESDGAPHRAQHCGSALRKAFGLVSNKNAVRNVFLNKESIFNALQSVKQQCVAENECEPLTDWFARIASYRASRCVDGCCK